MLHYKILVGGLISALLSSIAIIQHFAWSPFETSFKLSSHRSCEQEYHHNTSADAIDFISKLQRLEVRKAVSLALDPVNNSLDSLLLTIPPKLFSHFEDCVGLTPGVMVHLASSRAPRSSAYRDFLNDSFICAGDAFKVANESWPTQAMVLEMRGLMSVDWMHSTSRLPLLALRYKPIISALRPPGPQVFAECMRITQSHPGRPGNSVASRISRHTRFDQAISDMSGQPQLGIQPLPKQRSGFSQRSMNQMVHSAVGLKQQAGRRLLKGGGAFYGSYGDEYADRGACLGASGLVQRASLMVPISELKVSDILRGLEADDQVI